MLRSLSHRRDQNLAQKNLLLPHELVLVIVVVFLQFGFRKRHLSANLLPDHPLCDIPVLHLLLHILERHARLILYPLMKLIRIGDLVLDLNVGQFLRNLGIHVNIQLLALLDQQQLIDLVAQPVRLACLQQILSLLRRYILLFQFLFQNHPALLQLAPGDDVAVDLRYNLFDYPYLVDIGSPYAAGKDEKNWENLRCHITPL